MVYGEFIVKLLLLPALPLARYGGLDGPETVQEVTPLALHVIVDVSPERTRFGFAEISTLGLPPLDGVVQTPFTRVCGGVQLVVGLVQTPFTRVCGGVQLADTQLLPFHVWLPEHTVIVSKLTVDTMPDAGETVTSLEHVDPNHSTPSFTILHANA